MSQIQEIFTKHGLTGEEYSSILTILGREPSSLELGIFSVMWSEHCSYKSSRVHLKKLPTEGPQVIQGPGENAGVVDIGEGLAAIFKIESHNHPSFIEPYNGAATGVGGILRDIFTMGARPVALLNSLRFGEPDHPRTKHLVEGVVSGISGYGNRVGVPNVGGEVSFNKCYNGNNLVNAFALGIVKKDRIFKGVATGVGNPVIYAGAKTGRDGIHGATMASEEFNEDSEEKKPTVQVGDPFTEKLLIEACLELMKTDYIVGIQDMGAAGLTCSTIEMPGRSGMGIMMDLNTIPARASGMTPYELMLSESQERMLIVVKKGYEEKVLEIFKKYDLDAVTVGKVTDTGRVQIYFDGKIEADLPIKELSDAAPLYTRPSKKPDNQETIQQLSLDSIEEPSDLNRILLQLLASPALNSKQWVFEQYDHMVRANTLLLPGSDAAVIRVKGTNKALAMSSDCNSRYCYLDPYRGGMLAVFEAARNVVCSGATPLAVTNCLNFGSPEKPEIMWQFQQVLSGISTACIALHTPIISGNVSFYNETNNVSIYPTPVIVMVGLLDNYQTVRSQWFKDEGDIIVLLGETKEELGASEYLNIIHKREEGMPPFLDPDLECRLQKTCTRAIQSGIIKSAHDCSDGGIAIALTECCISGESMIGASLNLTASMRSDALLFGESSSRIIVSLEKKNLAVLFGLAENNQIKAESVGTVAGNHLTISKNEKKLISLPLSQLQDVWQKGFPAFMGENA